MRARNETGEILDGPSPGAELVVSALSDLERVNRRLLGIGPVLRTMVPRLATGPRKPWLADIGTGTGQIPEALRRRLARHGVELRAVGVDRKLAHLAAGRARRPGQLWVVAEAEALPFADASLEWSLSTLLLHHFSHSDNLRILREMRRVARIGVAVVDLRRSRLVGLAWGVLSRILRLGAIAAHDGRVSLARAWSVGEVEKLAAEFPVLEARSRFPARLSLVIAGSGTVERADGG